MTTRLYRAYDRLPEPRRFLTYIIPATVVIVVAGLAPVPWNLGALLVMVLVLLTRMRYINARKGS